MHAKIYVEGYGCTMNQSDTEKIRGFLRQHNFEIVQNSESAEYLLINTCAVKEPTEFKMLRRIKQLNALSLKNKSKLIVFGCLPKINPKKVEEISREIVQFGPDLNKLSSYFALPQQNFSPETPEEKTNPYVSIIPIAQGCLGSCAFCGTKHARGSLKSHNVEMLNKKFRNEIKTSREIRLTAQDTGCYGADIKTNLPHLLETLLQNSGNYRVRIGMMNPEHAGKIRDKLIPLLKHKNMYKFLHIPVQSGSDRILKSMHRKYAAEDYTNLTAKIKSAIPEITIATDVIAGFPSETDVEFEETLALLRGTKPDIVNISRYGNRPATKASLMKEQVPDTVKKERSRALTKLCMEISFENNKKQVGAEQEILVTDKGKHSTFVGRNISYKPVVVKSAVIGEFVKVKIISAFPTYLKGGIL